MNYFEFYGMAETFAIDAKALKNKFYELSKRYHPDYFANEDDTKQQEILELSTLNNKAYQVLSNPEKRMHYILQQHGMLTEDDKQHLPPGFLMEMMDINESLMDVDDQQGLDDIKSKMDRIENDIAAELNVLTKKYESENQAVKAGSLNGIKDIYYRQKYLLRIKESFNTFATRF